jgi:cephalosporin hydroxylase
MIEQISLDWLNWSAKRKYSYGFTWLGRPIIQYPQDILAMQELIWKVRPQLIIETGIAHGGSLVFSASMLQLVGGEGLVLGIDIDIRQHNRVEIEKHPLFHRIRMIEGSSIDPAIIRQVHQLAADKSPILVCLDSNHTHEHVLAELHAYAPLVSPDSYLVVFDTVVEDMPPDSFPDRPWGKGNNPKTAVQEFLATSDDFVIDEEIETRLQVTVAPSGYLRRVKN